MEKYKETTDEVTTQPEITEAETQPQTFPEPLLQTDDQSQHAENIDPISFLQSFGNVINPSSVLSIEKRPDDTVVIHCNNLYEYLKFGFSEDPEEVKKIEKHKNILEAFSEPGTVATAFQLKSELPEDEQEWIMYKLNAEGSAVPAEFNDGRKEAVVIMNDMPTRRMFNSDGTKRNEAQLQKYDKAYKRTVEHEVRHAQYYKKFGKDLEEWRKTMESIKPLNNRDQKKYHYNRYTKDEIAAHMENEVKVTTEINWDGIIQNLQKDDYRTKLFISAKDRAEYLSVSTALVNIAKKAYEKTRSIDGVMDLLASVDVEELMSND